MQIWRDPYLAERIFRLLSADLAGLVLSFGIIFKSR